MTPIQEVTALRAIADRIEASMFTAATTRLFADRSLWNSTPRGITLSSYGLSASTKQPNPYIPMVTGAVAVFEARTTDAPMVISTPRGPVTIPHWPAATMPDAGPDRHADIIDVAGNTVHSFWLLNGSGSSWGCNYYGAIPLDGSGWGDGARAAGVPASAGIIRTHEIVSAEPIRHALAMSLMNADLSPTPGALGWVPPANRSDSDNGQPNTGRIPEGALMMLPAAFDTAGMTPFLCRVAETLKTYGAYVVDRNDGTPYIIYTETGFDANTSSQATADLQRMRLALRMVSKVESWVDAAGKPFIPADTTLTPPSASPPPGAMRVCGENEAFTTGGGWHWYGAADKWVAKWLPAANYRGSNALFGDPISGTFKAVLRAP